MKNIFLFLILSVFSCLSADAQVAADKIIGNYLATGDDGKQSKIKFFKYQNGYRAQVYWVANPKNADGSVKLDVKNPDKARAKMPISQTIIIDKVTYEDGVWTNGKVYDPTTGKRWTVTIKFKDANTLAVRGSFLGIGKTVYWPRVK